MSLTLWTLMVSDSQSPCTADIYCMSLWQSQFNNDVHKALEAQLTQSFVVFVISCTY